MRAPVVLHTISSFDDAVLDRTATTIVKGFSNAISSPASLRNEITKSPDFWSTLQRLHQHKTEAEKVFDILTLLSTSSNHKDMQDQALTADNFESAISLANDFASAGSIGSVQEKRRDFAVKQGRKAKDPKPEDQVVVQRANKAISLVYGLTERVPGLIDHSHLERSEAWAAYWSPIFRALCAQCLNPCREVRHRAISALQRTLLSESVADHPLQAKSEGEDQETHTEWTAIFDEVLFPLTLRLLKPEIYQLDQAGMNETRAVMGGLLCKVFLRYLDRLHNIPLTPQNAGEEDGQEQDREEEEEEEQEEPADKDDAKHDSEKRIARPKARTSSTTEVSGTKMTDIWMKTLSLLDRLMNAGTIEPQTPKSATKAGNSAGDALSEAVREGVKNTLLVMDGAGYLGRQDTENAAKRPMVNRKQGDMPMQMQMWPETVRRLERFLPGLVAELFPVEAERPDEPANEADEASDGGPAGDENTNPGRAQQASMAGASAQTREEEKK